MKNSEEKSKDSLRTSFEESAKEMIKLDEKRIYLSYGMVVGVVVITMYFAALSGRVGNVEASQGAMKSQYVMDINELKTSMKLISDAQIKISNDVAVVKDRVERK